MKRTLLFFLFFSLQAPAWAIEWERPYGEYGLGVGYQQGAASSLESTTFQSSFHLGGGQDLFLTDNITLSLFGRAKYLFSQKLWGSLGTELGLYVPDWETNFFLGGALDSSFATAPTSSLWLMGEHPLPLGIVGTLEAGGFRTADSLGAWGRGGISRKLGALTLFLDGRGQWEQTVDAINLPSTSLSLGGQHPLFWGGNLWALGEVRSTVFGPDWAFVSGTNWFF